MKWAKEALNSVRTSLTVVLGYKNWVKGKCTAGPKEAQEAQVNDNMAEAMG